jgi:hypothetical protein
MHNVYSSLLVSHNDEINAALIIALNNALTMSEHHIIVRDFNLYHS